MKKIILSGVHGRMGKVLQDQIATDPNLTVVAGIDQHPEIPADFPIYATPAELIEAGDVVIDFSHHSVVADLVKVCVEKNLPLVVATTGLDADTKAMLHVAANVIPVFVSANMSLGINVLIKALQSVSPALEADFNMEIIEKHPNQKKDAPSGTALLLADAINDSFRSYWTYPNSFL